MRSFFVWKNVIIRSIAEKQKILIPVCPKSRDFLCPIRQLTDGTGETGRSQMAPGTMTSMKRPVKQHTYDKSESCEDLTITTDNRPDQDPGPDSRRTKTRITAPDRYEP